jgi:hypothetical protein
MIRKLAILLSCLCVTLIADAGGFPSRLKVQQVSVGSGGTIPSLGAGDVVAINGSPRWYMRESAASADNRLWRWYASSGVFNLCATNDVITTDKCFLSVSRSAAVNTLSSVAIGNATDNPAVTVNGKTLTVLKYANANIAGAGSSCTTTNAIGITSAAPSAGACVINYTAAGFSATPVCTVSVIDGSPWGIARITSQSSTSITVVVRDTANATQSIATSMLCSGT